MRSEVSYIIKDLDQAQFFIKDCITPVFFSLEINVYAVNSEQIWNDLMNKFLYRFENNVYNKISQAMEISKSAVTDYKALQFFEDMMMRDTLMKKLENKYLIVLEKIIIEFDNFRTQCKVRVQLNYFTKVNTVITQFNVFYVI